MASLSFNQNNSIIQYERLKADYNNLLRNPLSVELATSCAIKSWHLTDYVFEEYKAVHGFQKLGDFRASLSCPSLNIMHDIATESKHFVVSRPKSDLADTKIHDGDFSPTDFSSEFDVSRLELVMNNGTRLAFVEELEKSVNFWQNYLKKLK